MKNTNKNKLLQKKNDLMQQRADQLDAAAKSYDGGDTAGYEAAMSKVEGYNKELKTVTGLLGEYEKSFGVADLRMQVPGEERVAKSGMALVSKIRGTEKYADAWLTAMKGGISPEKGYGVESIAPLYEAEKALKALTIGGGEPTGTDGGFLVPIDFDLKVIELAKEYIDLSALVSVEHVNVNAGWRVIDSTGTRTKLSNIDEMGTLKAGQQPKFNKITYNCAKYGDKLIVSNELMADAAGLIAYLAGWWAPKYVLTKNDLILSKLAALKFAALSGDTDAAQIKAMKTLINTGLNTAHAKNTQILTNSYGYNTMDGWADTTGRPLLVPDPKGGDFSTFKSKKVHYADPDEIPNITEGGTEYQPFYVGNFAAFCRMFIRQGTRIKATDVGGDAWDTDSYEIRCTTRMDCQTVDASAVKRAGIKDVS